MEDEYCPLFLGNYQHLPLEVSISLVGALRAHAASSAATSAPAAAVSSGLSSPMALQQQALPAPPGPSPTLATAGADLPSWPPSGGLGGGFRLAPPPQPPATCAVGSMSPESQVVVIDTLREEMAPERKASVHEDDVVAEEEDDEDLLLGSDTAVPTAGSSSRGRLVPDGVDSDSDAEANIDGRGRPDFAPRPEFPPGRPAAAVAAAAAIAEQAARAAGAGGAATAPRPLVPALARPATHPAAPPAPDSPPSSPASPAPQFGQAEQGDLDGQLDSEALSKIDSQVSSSLDRFFNDDNLWQQVAHEVASSARHRSSTDTVRGSSSGGSTYHWRVQVPKPYPGVQYRRSKSLEDRYDRYAKQGQTVTGQVEDNGEWLRISGNIFLPMKVGNIPILEPLSPRQASAVAGDAARAMVQELPREEAVEDGNYSARWWACGQSVGVTVTDRSGAVGAGVGSKECGELHMSEDTDQQFGVTQEPKVTAPVRGSGNDSTNQGRPGDPGSGLVEEAAAVIAEATREGMALRAPRGLPEAFSKNPLADLDAANRLFSDPINPFSDSPRGGSPSMSPLRSRAVSLNGRRADAGAITSAGP